MKCSIKQVDTIPAMVETGVAEKVLEDQVRMSHFGGVIVAISIFVLSARNRYVVILTKSSFKF